jgi:tRNA-specific 2-thiouridylase
MSKNEVYVTTDLQDEKLWGREVNLSSPHWIGEEPDGGQLHLRTRHRARLVPIKKLNKSSRSTWKAELGEDIRALTPGQSAVVYSGEKVLGGGIIN